jgi:hypothetical protein
MIEKNKHSYKEVLNGLLKHEPYFINYIKSNNFEDDDLSGLKLFLENLNYDMDALDNFISVKPLIIPNKKKYFSYYKIAASFILIISISYLVKLNLNKKHAIAPYLVEDIGFKIWMSQNSSQVDLLNGMNYYRNKNYKEAIIYFSKFPNNDTALYYSGISAIQLEKLNEAETYFNNIPNESIYKNKSLYYTSLCFIFNNNQKKGIEILKNTHFDEQDYRIKKIELLEAINK